MGIKNFPSIVSSRFVSCIFICEISYDISCLVHNHIFIWARELTRSRMKYHLEFLLRTRNRLGFGEISYEFSHVEYNGRGFITNGPESVEYNSG